MKYKGLLLDLDNTIYDYDFSHKIALNKVLDFMENEFSIDKTTLKNLYYESRNSNHIQLMNLASSHNRLLYFQKLCEILKINPLKYSLKLDELYWETFLDSLQPFDGVYELFNIFYDKICFVTDLIASVQFRKLKKLKLDDYCRYIVTSEEAGFEKPHPFIFMLALNKLNLTYSNVCMIGDDFKKDILGANNLGIESIWLTNKNCEITIKNVIRVNNFREILDNL